MTKDYKFLTYISSACVLICAIFTVIYDFYYYGFYWEDYLNLPQSTYLSNILTAVVFVISLVFLSAGLLLKNKYLISSYYFLRYFLSYLIPDLIGMVIYKNSYLFDYWGFVLSVFSSIAWVTLVFGIFDLMNGKGKTSLTKISAAFFILYIIVDVIYIVVNQRFSYMLSNSDIVLSSILSAILPFISNIVLCACIGIGLLIKKKGVVIAGFAAETIGGLIAFAGVMLMVFFAILKDGFDVIPDGFIFFIISVVNGIGYIIFDVGILIFVLYTIKVLEQKGIIEKKVAPPKPVYVNAPVPTMPIQQPVQNQMPNPQFAQKVVPPVVQKQNYVPQAPEKAPQYIPVQNQSQDMENQLRNLKHLVEENLITQEEYDIKRKDILGIK